MSVSELSAKQQAFKTWMCDEMELSEYYESFIKNGYDDIEVIKLLNDQDLKEIGVDKRGSRMKLMLYSNRKTGTIETEQIAQAEMAETDTDIPSNIASNTTTTGHPLLNHFVDMIKSIKTHNYTNATEKAEIEQAEEEFIVDELVEAEMIETIIANNVSNMTNSSIKTLEMESIIETILIKQEMLKEMNMSQNATFNETWQAMDDSPYSSSSSAIDSDMDANISKLSSEEISRFTEIDLDHLNDADCDDSFERHLDDLEDGAVDLLEYPSNKNSMIDGSAIATTNEVAFNYTENAYLTGVILLVLLCAWMMCSFCYCIYIRICAKVDFMSLALEECTDDDIEMGHSVLNLPTEDIVLHDPNRNNKSEGLRPSLAERFNMRVIRKVKVKNHNGEKYDKVRKAQNEDDEEFEINLTFDELTEEEFQMDDPTMPMPMITIPSTKHVV